MKFGYRSAEVTPPLTAQMQLRFPVISIIYVGQEFVILKYEGN